MLKKYPLLDILVVIGCVSCFAILNAVPLVTDVTNPITLVFKQAFFYIIGFILCYIIYKVGSETMYEHIRLLYWIGMASLIVLAVFHIMRTRLGITVLDKFILTTGGATSWFNLKVFSLQPSEFVKIFTIMYLARMTKEYNERVLIRTMESELRYILKVAMISLPPAALIVLQNDSGVMLILAAGVFFVLLSSGLHRNWFIFIIGGVAAVVGVMAYLFVYHNGIFTSIIQGHTLNRVYGWLDPEGTQSDQGMQLWFSMVSYGSAGLTGYGFQAKVMTIPEAQTDFIMAIILTDYGYLGGLVVIALVAALDLTLLRIGLKSENDRDKFFCMGIIGMLMFQQIWNIGMILGLLPITGITLPFISYGGSSLFSYMMAIGTFLDIDYQNKLKDSRDYI